MIFLLFVCSHLFFSFPIFILDGRTANFSGFSDFESRVVFVDAKTFTAGVSFTNVGKGVVCVRAIPMPADILKDFSETDIPNMLGMAG